MCPARSPLLQTYFHSRYFLSEVLLHQPKSNLPWVPLWCSLTRAHTNGAQKSSKSVLFALKDGRHRTPRKPVALDPTCRVRRTCTTQPIMKLVRSFHVQLRKWSLQLSWQHKWRRAPGRLHCVVGAFKALRTLSQPLSHSFKARTLKGARWYL